VLPLPDTVEPQRPIVRARRCEGVRRAAFAVACATVATSGVALIVYLLAIGRGEPARWGVEALVAVAVVLTVYAMTRRWWARPMREMRDLVGRIRAGDAPIEELSTIGGGMRPIVPLVQELLRESRQQRCDLATLNDEIRQRVAQRTDALERTIGTLRQQATRDALTGLFNRRFLEQYLPQIVQRSVEQRTQLTVLMVDLDYFKALNDTLGHAAGDDLLRSVGQIVRSTLRGEDVPFRLGGDEFLIVMPASSAEHGWALGERLSSLVDALGRTMKVPQQPRLSFGVACLTDVPDRSVAGLSGAADRALYECKRQRRGAGAKGQSAWRGDGLQQSGSSLQCPAL